MRNSLIPFIIIICLFLHSNLYSVEYRTVGKINSVQNESHATVLLNDRIGTGGYYLFLNNRIIGEITVFQKLKNRKEFIGSYRVYDSENATFVRAGLTLVSIKKKDDISKKFSDKSYKEYEKYKNKIVSYRDKRIMNFIEGGLSLLGSNYGRNCEYPEQLVRLESFYIDKYEVSNGDYKKFADITGRDYPPYWEGKTSGGKFSDPYFSKLPVIATYREAESYAAWAGKRLPTEQEWEKAASSIKGGLKKKIRARYPWGKVKRSGIANTVELWKSPEKTELFKIVMEKYPGIKISRGYIPVDTFSTTALSRYGIANMCGNAQEWTSSWYKPHRGNNRTSLQYGTQYKVIKGGAYYLKLNDCRISSRKTGGVPNLYDDRAAGFRCVKDISRSDRVK